MPKDKQYFLSDTDSGAYAAWSLHSPAEPAYGNWAWVTVAFVELEDGSIKAVVTFVRQMTATEIGKIRGAYMVWGMKLPLASWALVQGRPGGSSVATVQTSPDPTRGVGV